jgi:hypothetical protein
MKALLLCIILACVCESVQSQNTDLPSPTANNQTLPSGSYVIAMDNTNQLNNSGVFNYKAYGLIVTLLNNSIKVKWVITAGKIKDGIDFTVNAIKFKPSLGSSAPFSFKAGPFVIFDADTTGVAAIIDTYNSSISSANDKIKVYKTNASVTVDIRYDLTGFVPKAAILTDGGNEAIHIAYMTSCNIPSANYMTAPASDLLVKCFTFASEPHNDKTGTTIDNAIAAVKRFTENGGNFLAQCAAISTYENNAVGHFQTTTGLTIANTNAGTSITYPNPDLSFSQFEGSYSISKGGSFQNWRINLLWDNNGHKQAQSSSDATVIGASVSKMRSGTGGLVFYLGNHRFDDQLTTQSSVNGIRMYMNAMLTPAASGNNCTIGSLYAFPLAVKLTNFDGNLHKNSVLLSWTVATNEVVDKFILEKSTDGLNYAPLAEMNSTYRSGKETYNYVDPMQNEKSFYRLKIVEHAGSASYSRVLIFQSDNSIADKLKIINNPVLDDRITFKYVNSTVQLIQMRILDLTGRIQLQQTITNKEGLNLSSILLPSGLAPGMYILDIVSGSSHQTAKFIKQ